MRHEFWLEVVMHHWTKYAVTMLGCLVAAGVVLSFLLPALRPHRRMLLFLVLAHIALWIGLMAGILFGMGRVLQGAHFVSHVLWSGVLCWMVMVLLYRAVLHRAPAVESGVPAASVIGS